MCPWPRAMKDNADGDRDNPGGIAVIPPYVYLGTLLLGLLFDRKLPAPLLPRGMARSLGWLLLGGGIALAVWFSRTMRRHVLRARRAGHEAGHGRAVPL